MFELIANSTLVSSPLATDSKLTTIDEIVSILHLPFPGKVIDVTLIGVPDYFLTVIPAGRTSPHAPL